MKEGEKNYILEYVVINCQFVMSDVSAAPGVIQS